MKDAASTVADFVCRTVSPASSSPHPLRTPASCAAAKTSSSKRKVAPCVKIGLKGCCLFHGELQPGRRLRSALGQVMSEAPFLLFDAKHCVRAPRSRKCICNAGHDARGYHEQAGRGGLVAAGGRRPALGRASPRV